MTRIALLCPTRGRPEQCRRMVESARDTTIEGNVKIFVGQADEFYKDLGPVMHVSMMDWPTVYSWNYLATLALKTDASLFMLAADDMIFATPGWDAALIEHYEGLKEKEHVYALRDSRDPDGVPHPIVTREYMEAMGYFIPPVFLHWFADTWTVAIGKSNSCFTHLKDFLLIHDKPSDAGQPDETHSRIRRQGFHERDKYVNDTCQHYLEHEKKRLDDYLRNKEPRFLHENHE